MHNVWRYGYLTFYCCATIAIAVGVALDAPSIASKAITQFNLEWAFGSVSEGTIGVLSFVGLSLLLAFFERRFPAGQVKPVSAWLLNLRITMVLWVLGPFLTGLMGVLLGYISSSVGVGLIDLRITHVDGIGKALGGFLVWFFTVDFFYYWWHRFQHESFLWPQHKVHHMDAHVSAITAQRGNWLESVFYMPMVTLPTALLIKFDPATGGIALAVISLFSGFWQMFFHANVKLGFGKASVLFTSPQLHRIHHSCLPQHYDKNFAGYFPILDIVFGTYHHPGRDEYPPTGVTGEQDFSGVGESMVAPLREWWRMFRTWRSGSTGLST